jgi:hypothetical protein
VVKRGVQDGLQTYWCREEKCGRRFRSERKKKQFLKEDIFNEFVFNKQTIRELNEEHGLDKKTIRTILDVHVPSKKEHEPRKIYLVADGTYFGKEKNQEPWCKVVFRDPKRKENLWWKTGKEETESMYREGRLYLESLGYEIASVTGDGFSGLRKAFFGIQFQMCLKHMKDIIQRGTTRNPILEAGKVLLALSKTLHKTDKVTFESRFRMYLERYTDFLNEKTTSMETGVSEFTHKDLRQAVTSLARFLPYLFTYENDKNIPKTSNSLEGHFSHIKDILSIHRGMTKPLKEKVIEEILLNSSIVLKKKKLEN